MSGGGLRILGVVLLACSVLTGPASCSSRPAWATTRTTATATCASTTSRSSTSTAVGTFVLINAWFVVVHVDGWWASYQFQALRDADITSNSVWYWGLRSVDNEPLNVLVPILLGASVTAALALGWTRARRCDEAYPNLAVCAAILCAFLLFNKAHSP